MRTYALVVAMLGLSLAGTAEAKGRTRRPARHSSEAPRVAVDRDARLPKKSKDPVLRDRKARLVGSRSAAVRGAEVDRSVGAPWAGRLEAPERLRPGAGYVLRRPQRAFGTRTTVELVHEVIENTLDAFPKVHVLAIGDLSAETGGQITEHHSHQSGRDADIGLFYKKQPAAYPRAFVRATAENLDAAATWKLIWEFAKTAPADGGAQIMFLDYDVQGIIYRWARAHDVSEARLDKVFQYPHGRGSANGLVRHFPNHDNHVHVRFKCRERDTACR